MRQKAIAGFVMGISLICGSTNLASAQCIPGSDKNFKSVKPGAVGDVLNEYGMSQTLDFLAEQSDSKCVEFAKVMNQIYRTKLSETRRINALVKRANDLLDPTVALLRKQADALASKDIMLSEAYRLQAFKARLAMAKMYAYRLNGENAARLYFMVISPEQKKAYLRNITRAYQILSQIQKTKDGKEKLPLTEELKDYIKEVQGDSKNFERFMLASPSLNTLQKLVLNQKATIQYSYVLANTKSGAEPATEYKKLLKNSIEIFNELSKDRQVKNNTPFYRDMEYFRGMALNLNGKFEASASALNHAIELGEKDSNADLTKEYFALSKNYSDWGAALVKKGKINNKNDKKPYATKMFKLAEQASKDLAKNADVHGEFACDWKMLILDFYENDSWAKALEAAGKKTQAAKRAERALDGFQTLLKKYKKTGETGKINGLWYILQPKLAGREFKASSPTMKMFLATMKFTSGRNILKNKLAQKPSFTGKVADLDDSIKKFEQIVNAYKKAKASNNSSKITEYRDATPGALWYLGVAYAIYPNIRNNDTAIEYFRLLGTDFPNDPKAFDALDNAFKIRQTLIHNAQQRGETIAAKDFISLDKTIKTLIDKFAAKKRAAYALYYDRALNAESLAEVEPKEKQKWLKQAVKFYQEYIDKTPSLVADKKDAAKFRELFLRYQLFKMLPKPQRKAKFETLKSACRSYQRSVYRKINNKINPVEDSEKKELIEWGSEIQYVECILGLEYGTSQEVAVKDLQKLDARWPGSTIIKNAKGFVIQYLLQKRKVQQALEEFEGFKKIANKTEINGLMKNIVQIIKEAIDKELIKERPDKKRLKALKADYIVFAKKVYDANIARAQADAKELPANATADQLAKRGKALEEIFSLSKLYADSLVIKGDNDSLKQAEKILKNVKAIEDKAHSAYVKEIKAKFADLKSKMPATFENDEDVSKARAKFKALIAEYSLWSWRNIYKNQASTIYREYKNLKAELAKAKGQDSKGLGAKIRAAAGNYRTALVDCYGDMEKRLLQNRVINADVIMLEAQIYQQRKQYAKAIKIYYNVISSIKPRPEDKQNYDLFWSAVVGYCQSQYALAKETKDEDAMDTLKVYFKQLNDNYPALGGPRFAPTLSRIKERTANK